MLYAIYKQLLHINVILSKSGVQVEIAEWNFLFENRMGACTISDIEDEVDFEVACIDKACESAGDSVEIPVDDDIPGIVINRSGSVEFAQPIFERFNSLMAEGAHRGEFQYVIGPEESWPVAFEYMHRIGQTHNDEKLCAQ